MLGSVLDKTSNM